MSQAKAAVASDKKSLPGEAAVGRQERRRARWTSRSGLGFYSTGDYAQAVEVIRRGIAKGGVARLDDANLLLGAALVELGKQDEARAAFEAAKAAAPAGSPLGAHCGFVAGAHRARPVHRPRRPVDAGE